VSSTSADDTLSCQPRTQPMWWLEKHDPLFFSPKISFSIHFDPRHLKNPRDLVKPIYDHKRPINRSKTWNPPGTKIIIEFRYVVLGVFKVKKHLKVPPYHMKLLIQKLTVLVTEIFPTSHFLSLSRNSMTLSLSPPNKKRLKIKK
jgi:hypothetical protein